MTCLFRRVEQETLWCQPEVSMMNDSKVTATFVKHDFCDLDRGPLFSNRDDLQVSSML